MAALLELSSVEKSYGAVKALQGISFEVGAGEVVALVGDNGAGKSTTAKIIAGAIRPDSGEVLVDGAPRRWHSPRDAQLAGIEMVYQDMGLCPHLSVPGNIYLGRELRRHGVLGRLGFFDQTAMAEGAERALAKLHVTVPAGEYPAAELSGGQHQAVALAKSLTWARKVLLLDEPTNHLGVSGTKEVLEMVRRVRDQGVAVIFISHTVPQVLDVADKIVVLWQGRVVARMAGGEATVEGVVTAITGSAP